MDDQISYQETLHFQKRCKMRPLFGNFLQNKPYITPKPTPQKSKRNLKDPQLTPSKIKTNP
jgi:hypothetical protein